MALSPLRGSVTFIYAKDFSASCKFYGECLGLPTAASLGDDVRIFAFPGAYLGVVKQGVSAAANPPRCAAEAGDTAIVGLICGTTEEVDAYHKRLAGAPVGKVETSPVRNDTFGLYNFMARGPNGYLWRYRLSWIRNSSSQHR